MKKNFLRGFIFFCLMIFVVGCGKSTSLEGKVVDGKGQPLANIKVTAKMSQPIKGYEQFETTTGSDGKFILKKLFPASEYQLIFYSDRWTDEKGLKIGTGPEGQTKILPEPFAIRFMTSKEGVIGDTKTDLEWFNRNQIGTNQEARPWVNSLSVAGGGWRMPTSMDVKSLEGYPNLPNLWVDSCQMVGEVQWCFECSPSGCTNSMPGWRSSIFAVRNKK